MPFDPLELPGPQFLLFYVVLLVVVAGATYVLRRLTEGGAVPSELGFDPYQIAYLRGGRGDAIHVAALSLLDRGLIVAEGDRLGVADEAAIHKVRRPLERAIIEALAKPADRRELYQNAEIRRVADALGESLTRLGLIPSAAIWGRRAAYFLGALALMWSVTGLRVARWLRWGRQHPIELLVVLSLAAPFVLLAVVVSRRTALGSRAIAQLGDMFAGLRTRRESLASGGATNEIALLAAIYGFSVLPTTAQERARATSSPVSATGGCGSSSCGGGSSCSGSSCGGGGCGGGCGGCG